ncbi:hypothetical protein Dsin_030938 [Dipteronia sinensis]|uniref:Ionotropic glutamate receptor C-terminal domain-containing protein n=1 Tax=Dipteronia sinensis TaxID=43782 RepID=A0AAD9ZKM2_9ROSI|nr:hypothetical protein Dsin_030938 [Dipteronia sinensis]
MLHTEIKRIKKQQAALLYFVVVFLSFFAQSFASHGDSSWSNKKLRLAVPQKSGRFSELVNINRDPRTNTTTISGFCIDVFKAAVEELDYQLDYELIPFVNATGQRNGTYSELIDQIFFQNYDGAVGDITITANRSLYVDFTLPFTDLGVGMIAPKGSNNMWIFLKPLTTDLWLSTAAFFVLTGFVIWLIERPINDEFQGSMSQQIGIIFWFSFSTLVFAHKEKLRSNLSRFVVIVWVFVVLILTSSYTATLTSMITVQHIQLNSKENYIGYRSDNSRITNTKGVISNLNFKSTNLKSFKSTDDYANALSGGIKNGGVSAIIDEIPYIKIFLSKYSADYSMVKSIPSTNGFAFVFHKGCPLVPDLSRAIAKLREDGKLIMMENAWFKSSQSATFTSSASEDPSNNNYVNPLTLDNFRGLFLITGVSSTLALAMLYGYWLYKNWHVMKNCNFRGLIRTRFEFMNEYFSKKIYHRTGETNVIHPAE